MTRNAPAQSRASGYVSPHISQSGVPHAPAARQLAVVPSYFTNVTSARSLAAASKHLTLRGALSSHAWSVLVPRVSAPPLSGELRRAGTDFKAFWAAWAVSAHSRAGAHVVGMAAQAIMRDVDAITTTCPKR
jgi:hypothetical protein